jgi:2-polyprenyl-3-methyl-5-hydroxy-6-metoxy-1,4-benzoquinol methylase
LAKYQPQSQAPLRLLDLGCGNGSLSHLLASKGYAVVGIDDSCTGIQVAQISFPDCEFRQISVYDLGEADLGELFDVIISVEVIEHLLYPKELIRAAKKHLKPEGCLIITTPYHGYWKNLALAITGKMDQHFGVNWDGGHIKFFSVKTLSQLLVDQGVTNLQFAFAGRIPYLWKSMLVAAKLSN